MLHQFTAKMRIVVLFIMILASTSNQYPMPGGESELIYETDSTTETTGSITMYCRDSITTEEKPLSEVQFWLNRSHACNLSLQERNDTRVIKVDRFKIKFNLTCHLEGNYTCGKCIENRVQESSPKTLICKYCNIVLHAAELEWSVTQLCMISFFRIVCELIINAHRTSLIAI